MSSLSAPGHAFPGFCPDHCANASNASLPSCTFATSILASRYTSIVVGAPPLPLSSPLPHAATSANSAQRVLGSRTSLTRATADPPHRRRQRLLPDLVEQRADLRLHGVLADAHRLGDVAARDAVDRELQDLGLARR